MPVWAAAVWLDLAAVTGAGDARVRPALHRGQTRRFGGGLVLLAQVASATGTFRLWHGIGSFRGDGDVYGGRTEALRSLAHAVNQPLLKLAQQVQRAGGRLVQAAQVRERVAHDAQVV